MYQKRVDRQIKLRVNIPPNKKYLVQKTRQNITTINNLVEATFSTDSNNQHTNTTTTTLFPLLELTQVQCDLSEECNVVYRAAGHGGLLMLQTLDILGVAQCGDC